MILVGSGSFAKNVFMEVALVMFLFKKSRDHTSLDEVSRAWFEELQSVHGPIPLWGSLVESEQVGHNPVKKEITTLASHKITAESLARDGFVIDALVEVADGKSLEVWKILDIGEKKVELTVQQFVGETKPENMFVDLDVLIGVWAVYEAKPDLVFLF